ncbi:MAG: NAD(P)H-hydrate dehydratase [Alphaproteobacteria bacterium]
MENQPDLWLERFTGKEADAHKYDYGHALIYGAPVLTGATRLAATACARIGAGLTSVLAKNGDIYRAALPAHIMVRDDTAWFDARVSVRLYGPGGMAQGVKISLNRPCVLDADALACMPEPLHENVVLSPHEGEFARAFPDITGSREAKAVCAAKRSGAVVVLKGRDTVIAHPDGRQVVVNRHASPYLASAGTGDVLAGLITGLLAQGMPTFEAACAAVWVHGDAALRCGPGLVASDLVERVPEVLQEGLGFSR